MTVRHQGARRLEVLDIVESGGSIRLEPRSTVTDHPAEVALLTTRPDALALVLWDEDLVLPAPELLTRLLSGPCHVWHAGLLMGQADRPTAWNSVQGRSMLSCDANPTIESTSWRLTLRALVVRNAVIENFGGFDDRFDTASGAALEAGLRWIQHGALIRHVPELIPPDAEPAPDAPPTPVDGIRFVRARIGGPWPAWATFRTLRNRSLPLRQLPLAIKAARAARPPQPEVFGLPSATGEATDSDDASVTVLLPTVGRYPYLETLLGQLNEQTRPPDEVVVVDQNTVGERRDLASLAPGLPIKVLHLLPPGQCTARNLGLRASTGTHILFLDDDDEVPNDLIEQHLKVLSDPQVSVSCGLVDDAEAGPAPASLRFRKIGDTFPTNNAMIRRSVLVDAGLFDPTYDRGSRADHDLGMRSYLAGNLHVYDPRPQVFHHHAPMGGLRTHGARVRTRANSRSSLTTRHLRTPTDLYLGLRYHTDQQVREDLALSVMAMFSGTGGPVRRLARIVAQLVLLPNTLANNRRVYAAGQRLVRDRPPIPSLND